MYVNVHVHLSASIIKGNVSRISGKLQYTMYILWGWLGRSCLVYYIYKYDNTGRFE